MLPENLPPLVQRTIKRLILAFAPEHIMLFGSYAKGNVQAESDVDLLVVTNLDANSVFQQRRARQITSDCFPPVDIVFATPYEISIASSVKSPFLLSIIGNSITLYTRMKLPSPKLDLVEK